MKATNDGNDGSNDMPMTVLYTKQQLSRERYTPEGIARLAMVIQATLHHHRLSERALAKLASISHKTLNKYACGLIRKPQADVLEALAPHILKVKSVDTEQIEVEPCQTYGTDWEMLDLIATADYHCQSISLPRRRSTDAVLN